ncbi:MAG TPA: PaaX family transcriptional regulator C-terminal domain-containing protein [Mycobacteriales bacterium]|jgi:phenylacetic acid degradation operon negative regulatory protein|nr:phenylacetic acid degradation operon negative regulatory protein [Actinomycetota bacterium]HEV7757001.1 PaaX family transcriptional regulator C-terminal domain-containing protein [Mycobacteriales bacterium]
MHARSALFDLYGDHLRTRGGVAPVATLVRLLAPVGIAAPAVRTAISRMVRQGWLRPERDRRGSAYALTPRAARRVDDAAARIYRTGDTSWDGRWHLLVVTPPEGRTARTRLANDLGFLGYGALAGGTWVSPRAAAEVDTLLADAGVRAERFHATHLDGLGGDTGLVRRAWDLDALAAAYTEFVTALRPVVEPVAADGDDERAFAARFQLVHAWRAFLFRDPGLPAALLPDDWPGTAAAIFFDHHAARLRAAAGRQVDRCLPVGSGRTDRSGGTPCPTPSPSSAPAASPP